MNNLYFNQKIDCHVEDCEYCNCDDYICTLGKITIETMKNKQSCTKEGTFCGSYQKRRITKE